MASETNKKRFLKVLEELESGDPRCRTAACLGVGGAGGG